MLLLYSTFGGQISTITTSEATPRAYPVDLKFTVVIFDPCGLVLSSQALILGDCWRY